MICPFVDRDCTKECKAYDEKAMDGCIIMHRSDRTNKILNFIEKKLDRLR